MSHAGKVVTMVATLILAAAGMALAADPSTVPPRATKQPAPATKPQMQKLAPFWFLAPTENAQIPAKTAFNVVLKATNPPPPGVYLHWEWKVSGIWQPLGGPPTGAGWGGTSLELTIPVPEGAFQQPGNYRVHAAWGSKKTTWRNFQIIPKVTLQTIPIPKAPPITPLPGR